MVTIAGARFDLPEGLEHKYASTGAVTKRENGQDFPAAAYAYVPNAQEPSTWKLRLWETLQSRVTAAQVGRAVAALGASFRGNKVQIPSGDRADAVAKVQAAWTSTHPGKTTQDMPGMLRHSAPVPETMNFSQPKGMPPVIQDDNGRFMVQGLPIFKTGGFRDSMNRFSIWETDDLDQMVENYVALRESGVFPNAPVRSDHSASVDKVVGWIDNLYHDGELLFADYEFTQPAAVDNYSNGTYRNVSAEIGPYTTNGGDTYFPCMRGFAFVDLNAVEGLNNFSRSVDDNPIPPEETPVAKFRISGVETEDGAQVQAHIDKLEGAAANPTPHAFRIGGEEVADAAEVQTRITVLETFRDEAVIKGRTSFVDDLVKTNKLAAPQGDSVKEFVKSLSAEQFETYKKSFDAAPTLGTFSAHTGDGSGAAGSGAPANPIADEIATCEGVIAQYRLVGDTDETIQASPSYKRLQTLRAQVAA